MPDKLALGNVPIQFGPLSNGLFPFLNELEAGRQLFVIADDNTWPLVPDFLRKESHIVIRPGEVYKNLDTCSAIWEAMIACGLDRKGLVINFGGGVIGDMGGFCAASFKRGLGFIQVPTSLLAMTDAAIGGKVGVDFRDLKNILGAFEEPEAIFIDTDPSSLPGTAGVSQWPGRSIQAWVYRRSGDSDPTPKCQQPGRSE